MRNACLVFLGFIIFSSSFAQVDSAQVAADSAALAKAQHKKLYQGPKRAGMLSAILPGLGQAYNGKYWKIPIIYAAFGGGAYIYISNSQNYNIYRNALRNSVSDSTGYAIVDGQKQSSSQLSTQKAQYKKNRDIGVIVMAVVYIFNIVDASVDAHLKTFDISDDLSLQVRPTFDVMLPRGEPVYSAGFSCRLTFR